MDYHSLNSEEEGKEVDPADFQHSFTWIEKNIYSGAKTGAEMKKAARKDKREKGEQCNCSTIITNTKGKCFDDSCSLRKQGIECGSRCGTKCSNKPFSGDQIIPQNLKIKVVRGKGRCLFTTQDITEGSFICEYVGMIKTFKEMEGKKGNEYAVDYKNVRLRVDATNFGSYGRFAACSHKPNMIMKEYLHAGEYKLVLMACKDIEKGSELTWYYGGSFTIENCLCGESNCPNLENWKRFQESRKESAIAKRRGNAAAKRKSVELESESELDIPTNEDEPPATKTSASCEIDDGLEASSSTVSNCSETTEAGRLCVRTGKSTKPLLPRGNRRFTAKGRNPVASRMKKRRGKGVNGVVRYVCEYCDSSFGKKTDLHRHHASHQNLRGFPCTVDGCNKAYNTQKSLFRHSKTHSSERPFKCAIKGCKETFQRKDVLLRHFRNMHPKAIVPRKFSHRQTSSSEED